MVGGVGRAGVGDEGGRASREEGVGRGGWGVGAGWNG